jgi:hypothetical protein
MIVKWLVDALSWAVAALLDLLPDWTPPDGLTGAASLVGEWLGSAAALGNWVPLGIVVSCIGALFAAWLVHMGIRFGRIAASFLTAGGGSAA